MLYVICMVYEYYEEGKEKIIMNGTWSNVAVGASNGGHGLRGARVVQELGKAKISNMGLQVPIQQYIIRLDIPVNDKRGTIMVQIAQSLSSFHRNLVPHFPLQVPSFGTMQPFP